MAVFSGFREGLANKIIVLSFSSDILYISLNEYFQFDRLFQGELSFDKKKKKKKIMTPGGTHMLRYTGACRPNGLVFHQISSDKGLILVKKILKRGPISPKLREKNVTSAVFEAEKTLKWVPICSLSNECGRKILRSG